MLGSAVQVGNRACAAAEFFGDPGNVLLRHVAVIAVEGLPREGLFVGSQEQATGAGNVFGVHSLSASGRSDCLAAQHPADQIKPSAALGRVVQTVNARWPKRADRPTLTEPVTMHEFLKGGLVGAVVADW